VVAVSAVALEAYLLLRPAKRNPYAGPLPGELGVGRLIYDGDWNTDPLAFVHLGTTAKQLGLTLKVHEIAGKPSDPGSMYFPLLYLHGRGAASFSAQDLASLRHHLVLGGGTLFADAACGSPAFDASFRRFVTQLFPNDSLVAIPRDDKIFSTKVGFDLSACRFTNAAGRRDDFPQLEGVEVDGRWTIVYSKYGIGCTLDRDHDSDCKGYLREDAGRIGVNVLIYSTLP
jgi:hypothetical protein